MPTVLETCATDRDRGAMLGLVAGLVGALGRELASCLPADVAGKFDDLEHALRGLRQDLNPAGRTVPKTADGRE